jgi:hypothetical protein
MMVTAQRATTTTTMTMGTTTATAMAMATVRWAAARNLVKKIKSIKN